MIEARHLLKRDLPKTACAIHELPNDVAQAAVLVANYLENVGLLVYLELVEPRIAIGFLGGSAERIWDELKPFIGCERTERDGLYLEYFQYLVATIRLMQSENPRSELRELFDGQ